MKKLHLGILAIAMLANAAKAQNQIITTGNNVINTSNPYAADIVIGSDAAGGARHDASIMLWSYGSASRIWNTADVFYLSQWYTTSANVALAASYGGASHFQGSLGIGTDSPQSLFQVDDGCTRANIGDASGSGLNYGTSYLGFNASRSGTSWLTSNDGNNHNGGGVMYSTIYGDMYFANIPSTVSASGQSLSDEYVKSHINFRIDHDGTAHAKKVMVELTGWPDYVFRPTYTLRPLSEVKAYIDLNHHLPEMPSDREVADKGLDVGEMNKLLTKKVEELTLYLIEKDKENKAQSELLQKMEKRIEALEAKRQ